ncbi:MAG: B12-binding domain-containing radical SAM protein [Candidatus Bruticola sp.]
MLDTSVQNMQNNCREQIDSAPGASPGSAEAVFNPAVGSPEQNLHAPWAPKSGWYGEAKDFSVVLIAMYSVENAGLRYLSAALRRAGFKVNLIFLRDWVNNKLEMPSAEELELVFDIIAEKKANFVGIGFISSLLSMAEKLTVRLRERFPHLPICWGGIHVTAVPEGALDYADYLCLGEGEAPLIDLCEALYNNQFTGNIFNIWAKLNGKIFKNEMRPLIANLDELPYPDVDDFNKFYIEDKTIHNEEPWKRTAEYRIYCSRGCPYNCSYCYVSILREKFAADKQKFYRLRSVEHILGELEYIKAHFPRLARVKIDDDTAFAAPAAWVDEFCTKYPQRINLPFECMLIPPMLKRPFLEKLQKAGLVRLQTGIESGSPQESLSVHNRVPGNNNILAFSKFNRELRINAVYDLIIDNPWASESMKLETAQFLLELERPYDIYFYSLNYFPGTAITKRLLAEGRIDATQVEGLNNKAWKQFRVSMDWPRSPEDRFYLSIYCLASKTFIPKAFIRFLLKHRQYFKHHWQVPFILAWAANFLKMGAVAWRYLINGELTWFKIRQYGDLRKLISQ